MKIAHITPPIYNAVNVRTAYTMALGQYLLSDPGYRKHYMECHTFGGFLMVDNGEAEGEQCDFEKLVQAVDHFTDEFCLPDVFRDMEQTLAKYEEGLYQRVPPRKRAIIPQGDTLEEWWSCYQQIHERLDGQYRTICIPKHLERFERGRLQVIEKLVEIGASDFYDIHMLGVWTTPLLEIAFVKDLHHVIRGMDTGAAVAWAQNHAMVDETGDERFSLQWDGPFDPERRRMAEKNAEMMEVAANAHQDF